MNRKNLYEYQKGPYKRIINVSTEAPVRVGMFCGNDVVDYYAYVEQSVFSYTVGAAKQA